MGTLVVIEGLDGSGKATLATRLTERWRAAGRTVAAMSFPRYGRSIHADLVRDVLYGRLGDLADSVYGAALLFALDRRDAADEVRDLLRRNDIVLLDRYIASNAAYGAARLGARDAGTGAESVAGAGARDRVDPATAFPRWVRELEVGRFGIPVPDHQLLLATPAEVAAGRARGRAEAETARALDTFETDADLQRRTAAIYTRLAGARYLSAWTVLKPGPEGAVDLPDALAP